MANHRLALPFRIDEILPALRRLLGFHLVGVVGEADGGGVDDLVGVVGVDALEPGVDRIDRAHPVGQQQPALLQRYVLPHVGGGEHVAIGGAGLNVLAQPLIGDLRGGAHHVDLHAGEGLGENRGMFFGTVRGPIDAVPGQFAFLFGLGMEFGDVVALRAQGPQTHQRRGGAPGDKAPPIDWHAHSPISQRRSWASWQGSVQH
jgi:hypothetical protein